MSTFSFEEATTFSFEEAGAKAPPKIAMGDIDSRTAVAETGASLVSGAVAMPIAGIAGITAAVAKTLGITDVEAADVVRKVQSALTYEPESDLAKKAVSAVAYPFEKLAEGADAAGQKVTDVTGSPALGAAANTTIQAAPMLLGPKAKPTGGVAEAVQAGGKTMMQSALKPTWEKLRTGKGEAAATTLLEEGANVTRGGAEKLQNRITELNDRIKAVIDQSPATIDKQHVGYYVQGVIDKFKTQVNAADDLAAIQKAWDQFLNDPNIPANIPVKQAQEYKQGTYRALKDKAYGELKSADIEAQKALARGLKEEIARAVPDVRKLNAEESKLLNALPIAERRILMDANKNPAGLGWLTASPDKFALWMADRSPLFKSLIARMTYSTGEPLEAAARATVGWTASGGPATAEQRRRREELLRMLP